MTMGIGQQLLPIQIPPEPLIIIFFPLGCVQTQHRELFQNLKWTVWICSKNINLAFHRNYISPLFTLKFGQNILPTIVG